jgi:hypothetical protein
MPGKPESLMSKAHYDRWETATQDAPQLKI